MSGGRGPESQAWCILAVCAVAMDCLGPLLPRVLRMLAAVMSILVYVPLQCS